MYRTDFNNYHQKPKNSTIYTPPAVSQFIFELFSPYFYQEYDYDHLLAFKKRTIILDPCSGQGSLLKPWFENDYPIFGIDIERGSEGKYWSEETPNLVIDFLTLTPERMTDYSELTKNPILILCNPPFNGYGNKLGSEVWLDKIIELFGKEIPLVLFVPMGFCANMTLKSQRLAKFHNGTYPPITSRITLPKNIFEGVTFHSEILIFNIKGLKGHYFLNPTSKIEQRTPI